MNNPYVHSTFTLFLVKQISENIKQWWQHPKAGRSFGPKLPLIIDV